MNETSCYADDGDNHNDNHDESVAPGQVTATRLNENPKVNKKCVSFPLDYNDMISEREFEPSLEHTEDVDANGNHPKTKWIVDDDVDEHDDSQS